MFSLVPRTVVRYAREADIAEGLVGNCQHAGRWYNGSRLATDHGGSPSRRDRFRSLEANRRMSPNALIPEMQDN